MAAGAPTGQQVYFNPFDEAYRANPYPYYKPLYGRPPVLINLVVPIALVGRYADAAAILRDHERFSSVPVKNNVITHPQHELFANAATVLFSDPPNHTRLRRLVSRAFTPKRIKDLEPRIHEITKMLLDRAASKGEFEAVEDLATPLPVMVIAQMLGIPPEDYTKFKDWSDRIIERRNIPPGMPVPSEISAAIKDLGAYFDAEIEKRRRNPTDDLIGVLVAAHEEAEALSAAELRAFVILLLLAGNETTTNLIGNGMLALGRNPDQLELLKSNRTLMPRAIEEMLRYDDITREPNDHLAFGDGIHYCLGAALARLEGASAFGSVLDRFPRLRLADPGAELKYRGSCFLRGLAELQMAIR